MENKGTPKTLTEAIFNAFEAQKTYFDKALMDELLERIQDYQAQEFGIAMIAEPQAADILKKLFNKIFRGAK